METNEQILERQQTEFRFRDGKVEYFSISTQWDAANTLNEAIKNIIEADRKYNGRAPITHWMEQQNINYENISCEELSKIVEIFNNVPEVYTIPQDAFMKMYNDYD